MALAMPMPRGKICDTMKETPEKYAKIFAVKMPSHSLPTSTIWEKRKGLRILKNVTQLFVTGTKPCSERKSRVHVESGEKI